jgi:hypothetical protein
VARALAQGDQIMQARGSNKNNVASLPPHADVLFRHKRGANAVQIEGFQRNYLHSYGPRLEATIKSSMDS